MSTSLPRMPPMGVTDALLSSELDSVGRFRFWLLSHASPEGPTFWRRAVLRECLPDSNAALIFETVDTLGETKS